MWPIYGATQYRTYVVTVDSMVCAVWCTGGVQCGGIYYRVGSAAKQPAAAAGATSVVPLSPAFLPLSAAGPRTSFLGTRVTATHSLTPVPNYVSQVDALLLN